MSARPLDTLPVALLQAALAHAEDGVVVVDGAQPDLPVVWANPAFERITGYSVAELAARNLRVLQGGDRQQPGLAELREGIAGERPVRVVLRNYRPDGTLYWHDLAIHPCRDGDDSLWWIGITRDVSRITEMELALGRGTDELHTIERRLEEVDPVDRLTGLQNERSFELALELAWFSCARERRSLALFLFAPDSFEVYLETFGRVAGDSCLRMLSRCVGSAFRRASDVTARLGDAEFATLGISMPRELLEPHARRVCDRVRALAIHNPRAPLGRNLTVSAAVLLAVPGQAPDWRGMLVAAREALNDTQAQGREQVSVRDYSPGAPGA